KIRNSILAIGFGFLVWSNPFHNLHDLRHGRNSGYLLFRTEASRRRVLRSLRTSFLAFRPPDNLPPDRSHSRFHSRRNRPSRLRPHRQAINLADASSAFPRSRHRRPSATANLHSSLV